MSEQFIPEKYKISIPEGSVCWQAPSNIALIKYWGKREIQIPRNPSLSFTLSACATRTSVHFSERKEHTSNYSIDFYFEGEQKEEFLPKIHTFFERAEHYLPFLRSYHFEIRSENTFPHSSGIASSASSMAALAICFVDMERQLLDLQDEALDLKKASFIARLGSGSACRSLDGKIVEWGRHEDTTGSSDLYGISWEANAHEIFRSYHDTILLIDKGEKQVSSTVGHGLMEDHPYAEKRFYQAHDHLSQLQQAMSAGDLDQFITLVELEALTLHAMMLTSKPSFILMKPNTLEVIRKLQGFREASGLHPCFTLDAGANVHILYPENEREQVYQFIKNELVDYCENGGYICDMVGDGAKKISAVASKTLVK